jgi:thioredoxin 1
MSKIVHVDDNNFESEILQHKGVAVVDFFADWCSPCRFLGPIIEKLSEEYSSNPAVKFVKLDVDAARQTAMKLGIRAIPTVIYFKDGAEAHRALGVQPAGDIKAKVESLAK